MKLGVVFGLRDAVAEFSNVAGRNPEAVADFLQLFTWWKRQSHAAFYNNVLRKL